MIESKSWHKIRWKKSITKFNKCKNPYKNNKFNVMIDIKKWTSNGPVKQLYPENFTIEFGHLIRIKMHEDSL